MANNKKNGSVNRGKRPTIFSKLFSDISKRNKEIAKYGADTSGIKKPKKDSY